MEQESYKKTMVIFGISSFVGSSLAEFFKHEYRVIGTYFSTSVSIPGVLTVPCDVMSKEEVQMVMFAFKPSYAIYSVGLSSLIDCSKRESLADGLNTVGLFNVADASQRYRAKLCYISSVYVFGGENRDYLEMDIPDANTIYGKTKASAEFFIQKTSLNYLIFRCSALYGRSINHRQLTWFEKLQRKLRANEGISCDDYVHIGMIDVTYLAMVMKICFERGATNRLYQLSSSDVATSYEFAQLYCQIFNESETLPVKGRWHFPHIASHTSNYDGGALYYRMDTSNVEGYLNINLPTIEESLRFTYKKFCGEAVASMRNQSGGGGIAFI